MVKSIRRRPKGRLIRPIASASLAPATGSFLAAGSRLIGVKGENTTSPTYDFVVQMNVWTGGVNSVIEWKYCGIPNGVMKDLTKDYPFPATTNAATTAFGNVSYQIISGTMFH